MATFSEIIELIQHINDELDLVDNQATDGLLLARTILERFPNNFGILQLTAFLNTSLFYAETARRQLQHRLEDTSGKVIDDEIQEMGEELSNELGRVLETKIRVSRVVNRLENLS